MKSLALLIVGMFANISLAMSHRMQHGFILSKNDTIASHLVAEGHHSYQVTLSGKLVIMYARDRKVYEQLKTTSPNKYFLFQAQDLNITKIPDQLFGHLVQMEVGKYEPKGPTVDGVIFKVDEVLGSLPNPFFGFTLGQP